MARSDSSDPLRGRMKFLTFGAGAISTYVGGSLILAGHEVVFVERPRTAKELRERGLRLDLTLDERRNARDAVQIDPGSFVIVASLEDALRYGPFDTCLFALKSFDTHAALAEVRPFAGQMPPVLCLSNGVDNERAIGEALGIAKVIAGTVTSAVGRRAAGDIVLDRARGLGIARGHPLSARLHVIMNGALLNSRLYEDAASMKWSKLLTNLVANPTSAILDMTPGEIFADSELFKLEIEMLRECLAVMEAQGIKVVDLPGVPVRALAFALTLPLWLSKPVLGRAAGTGRGAKMPSFHIDLHSGRGRSEVDHLHGAVARAGEKFHVPTPVNRVLTETLAALTSKELPVNEFARNPARLLERMRAAGVGLTERLPA